LITSKINIALLRYNIESKLSGLENKDLKPLIYDWSRHNKTIEIAISSSRGAFDYLLNYIKAHVSLRQLDLHDAYLPEGSSVLRPDNGHLMRNPQFENAIEDYLVYTRQIQEHYKAALSKFDRIIAATDVPTK
jgi:hypothetical protein